MTRVVSCQNCGETHCIEENVVCSECGSHVEKGGLGANPWNDDPPTPTCGQDDCKWCSP